MDMKRLLAATTLLLLPATAVLAQEAGRYRTDGGVWTGLQQFDNDTDSSKLEEYRDFRDGAYVPRLRLDVFDTATGRFLDLSATNVPRDDQDLRLLAGGPGTWRLEADWSEIPHLLSNKARTPYFDRGNGLFDVPATIPITFKKLNTGAPDAPGVRASDELIAAFAQSALRPTELGTQREGAAVRLQYTAIDAIKLRLGYTNQGKSGRQVGYGPIGDRPPRTLNIQLAEPVDQRTQDVRVEAEHIGKRYQAQLSYEYSDFANSIDTFTWQNVFANPATGSTFDVWDRAVSAFGRRPPSPDNQYQSATVTLGAELPWDSHLTASAAYGRMEQDQSLLPYSFHSNALANPDLPRSTAQARIDTTHLSADYTVGWSRLNLRAHFRYYDLDNQTPESNWQYVTQDTSNLNGTVSFKNKRVSLAYAYRRRDEGLDATWRLGFWGGALGLGYEREDVDRRYREADTGENRLKASFRARPANGVSLRAGYLYSDRDGDYDPLVTRASYWYAPAEAGTDADNPRFAFSNHPDMRRFDVSDRVRQQLDLAATLTRSAFSASASIRHRKDDFDSGVAPSQPLLGTGVREENATSPGDQLGLLDHERLRYSLDLVYAPGDRWSVNAFGSWETAQSRQRGLEFNENNKQNPSAVATAPLGPWTRAGSQWTTDLDDGTRSFGVGGSYVLVPDRLTLAASYTLSRSRVEIGYAGFGVTNWDGTPFPDNHEFAFRTPPEISHDTDVVDLTLNYRVDERLEVGVGYLYDRFDIRDWQQETGTPWFESVGSEFLLRDTSRSHQWGNRLFNLGSYLAPQYKAHVGYVTLAYRF
jgi:MtrB/PioB family decaheme-associated outer membrane protein